MGRCFLETGDNKVKYSFEADNALIKLLNNNRKIIICDDLCLGDKEILKQVKDTIKQLDLVLLIPVFIDEELLGFLSLGRKENREFYSQQDLELLENLASQVAVAAQNIKYDEELKANKSKLLKQERLRGLGEMSAGFVHQINNPLGGVAMASGLGEMIIQKYSEQVGREGDIKVDSKDIQKMGTEFKKIGDFVEQVDKIIRSITTFSKDSEFGEEDIKELIEVGIGLVPVDKLEGNNVKIEKKIAQNLPAVRAKAIDIEQIIMNLVTNAIDAIGNAGGEIVIEVKKNPKKAGFVELKITDTGCGMSDEVLDKIFDIFYTTKGTGGTGLGLHLVYKMIQEHKGEITVTSIENRGTAFTIYLPVFNDFVA